MLLISCLISMFSGVWYALSTSYSSFLGARILGGLGAAANESIMAMTVADMLFLPSRGRWINAF